MRKRFKMLKIDPEFHRKMKRLAADNRMSIQDLSSMADIKVEGLEFEKQKKKRRNAYDFI